MEWSGIWVNMLISSAEMYRTVIMMQHFKILSLSHDDSALLIWNDTFYLIITITSYLLLLSCISSSYTNRSLSSLLFFIPSELELNFALLDCGAVTVTWYFICVHCMYTLCIAPQWQSTRHSVSMIKDKVRFIYQRISLLSRPTDSTAGQPSVGKLTVNLIV